MNTKNLKLMATRAVGTSALFLRKHKSDILIGVGLVGTVAAFVGGCKASMKLEETSAQCSAVIKEAKDIPESEDPKTREVAIAKAYGYTAGKYVKLYGPSVSLMAVSFGCIVAGHIQDKRDNRSLAMAYATMDRAFRSYRQRVIEELGEETDNRFRFGIREKKVEVPDVDPETGEVTGSHEETVLESENVPNKFSPTAFLFDSSSRNWSDYNEDNDMFCRMVQASADAKLQANGHLFLNDVRKMFGLKPTPAGQSLGWILNRSSGSDPDESHHVEFGIAVVRHGDERAILIDPNIDGPILAYFDDSTLDEEFLSESQCEVIHSLRRQTRGRV